LSTALSRKVQSVNDLSSESSGSDAELMRRAQAGESDSFAELARRYRPALVRVARSRLGSESWAEDVVQETLLAAFKSRHTYRAEFSFRTWLWTILLNQCRSHYQRQARSGDTVALVSDESSEGGILADCPSGEAQPSAGLLAREQSELLESLLGQLSTVQADALRLRFFGGLKFQEIADTMQCSLGTAKNRVQWGLTRLSDLLRRQESHSATITNRPVAGESP
jgi:RNA polymerase sigma-70 factor, ECF subfamily